MNTPTKIVLQFNKDMRTVYVNEKTGRALFEVTNTSTFTKYMLKRLDKSLNPPNGIKNEMVALNRLPRKLAPACHHYWEDNHFAYLLLDYIPGKSLKEVFNKPLKGESDFRQRLKALQIISKKLVQLERKKMLHRDVKPENIILETDNGKFPNVYDAHLIDFGMSNQKRLTEEGSLGYNAPEQRGNRGISLTNRLDIFSLGQVGWFLFHGAPLELEENFSGDDWSEVNIPQLPDFVPNKLVELLIQCVQFEPKNRPHSAYVLTQISSPRRPNNFRKK